MSGYLEVHVPPPPDGSSGVTRYELMTQRWEIGDVFMLMMGDWVRKVRVVRVTDTGPNTREYTLRELDDGNQVFQPEADEEEFDPHRLVRAYAEQQGQQGFGDAEGRHEGRQQVGGCDGSTRKQEHGPDLEGSDCEVGRAEADGEGLDGSVDEGRLRAQQAGLEQGCGSALAEGPVLARLQRWRRGVSAAGVVLADDRRLDVVHVECCGGGAGGVAGPGRVPAPQDRDRLSDLRAIYPQAPVDVSVPAVDADLLRLRNEDAR